MSAIKERKLAIDEVLSADVIADLKLNNDASRLVYCVHPHYKSGDHSTSALWLADTATAGSARKLTSGVFNDQSPRFHLTSSRIYFLSDRHHLGGSSHIYSIPLDATPDTTPERGADLEDAEAVSAFSISPDGNSLAFISQLRSSDTGAKELISIWREKKDLACLRLLHLQTKHIRTLVSGDAHVDSFSWSPDSSSILYRLRTHADLESTAFPVTEEIVTIATGGIIGDTFKHPHLPGSATIWRENGDFVFLQNTSSRLLSSRSVWQRKSSSSPVYLAYGDEDDVLNIVHLASDSRYAVKVATGLDSKLDVFDADHKSFTAFETLDEDISSWDIKYVDGRYIYVAVRSSGVKGDPPDVWSGKTEHGRRGLLTKKLSSHHTWLSHDRAPYSGPFYWSGVDGHSLQGVMSHPRGIEPKNMPTVIVPHGGPTARDTLSLSFEGWSWRQLLASHGYLVLSPNYRGSIGRGDAFVKPANGTVGTLDWDDIQTMIDEGVGRGLVDPQKLAIAGYSQGGFLAAWGCTRPNNIFKAGVIGAGVTDWGILTATSDLPDIEAAIGGAAPWDPREPVYRNGSPIKDCKNVRTPLLLLHGKEDKRVPLTQAIAFVRGVAREAPDSLDPLLVIYPREDHDFKERANAEDVLRRLVRHLDAHLK